MGNSNVGPLTKRQLLTGRTMASLALMRFWLAIFVFALGCGDAAAPAPVPFCAPGQQVDCPCGGGAMGVQVCRDDGRGYEACSCGGAADAMVVGRLPDGGVSSGEACMPSVAACANDSVAYCGEADDGCGGKMNCGECEVSRCYSTFDPVTVASSGRCGCWIDSTVNCDAAVAMRISSGKSADSLMRFHCDKSIDPLAIGGMFTYLSSADAHDITRACAFAR